jgi:hypothetical protein
MSLFKRSLFSVGLSFGLILTILLGGELKASADSDLETANNLHIGLLDKESTEKLTEKSTEKSTNQSIVRSITTSTPHTLSPTNNSSLAQDPSPPPTPATKPEQTKPEQTKPEQMKPEQPKPDIVIDAVQLDSSYQADNFNLKIFSLEPSVTFRLANGNKLSLKAGIINLRDQAFFRDVNIYPVRLGWEGNVEQFALKAGTTFYTYDRLRPDIGFDAGFNVALLPNLFFGGTVERTPMKYAPSTLEVPGITNYTAYGPSLFWAIDRDTSLFGFISFINVNDGNAGSISLTKLKRNLGQFFVAANVVTTSYAKDSAPFIFTPQDFFIYNGEIGWQGDLATGVNFKAQVNLGEQRLRGEWTNAFYYEMQLTAKISEAIDAFVNYNFGKFDQTTYFRQLAGTGELYSRYLITAQIRMRF